MLHQLHLAKWIFRCRNRCRPAGGCCQTHLLHNANRMPTPNARENSCAVAAGAGSAALPQFSSWQQHKFDKDVDVSRLTHSYRSPLTAYRLPNAFYRSNAILVRPQGELVSNRPSSPPPKPIHSLSVFMLAISLRLISGRQNGSWLAAFRLRFCKLS